MLHPSSYPLQPRKWLRSQQLHGSESLLPVQALSNCGVRICVVCVCIMLSMAWLSSRRGDDALHALTKDPILLLGWTCLACVCTVCSALLRSGFSVRE